MLGLSTALYIFNIHVMPKALLAALIFALFLVPLTVIRMRSLGVGDSKLILVLAILLGSGDRTVSALIFASCFAVIQIALIYLRSHRWPKSIPFAPALIFGALLSV
jgi:prepilin signal peptidase PulO-like enzyme (type II secretory pathway)